MPDGLSSSEHRRARGLTGLSRLLDRPGCVRVPGRLGPLGDRIVGYALGGVPISVAMRRTPGGCEPQLAAHIRAMRAIQVGWEQIEEASRQSAPTPACRAITVPATQQEEDDR